MAKRHYVTTPIYYVNGAPHIGTALTTAVCDFERRYRAMRGEPAWFLTGTDENATKVVEAAQAAGKESMAFVDEMAQRFKDEWAYLHIEFDDFIRTTEPRHEAAVQKLFEILRDNGYVYQDKYEGWYDVSAETFVRETDLVDGKSPDGNEVRWVSEENWFFKLSAFGDRLLAHIEANPTFLLPESRKNEVVSFVKSGLRDMCITRKNPGWGVPVPGDPEHVVYVWFDALINYLAATGWPEAGWEDLWPADVHWMAKEIFTRFHATLWPAMLMGAGLPLPKTVIAHGWFTFSGEKISKSKKGGLITPRELAASLVETAGCSEAMAIDVVRYSLAAFLPYEGDKDFSVEEVERRYNSDLANDLGNALNRTLAMAHKFAEGRVPDAPIEPTVLEACLAAKADMEVLVESLRWDQAVDRAISVVRFLNKYIDDRAPWALAKANDPSLGGVLRSMIYCVRTAEGLIRPVMPMAADAIAEQLGMSPLSSWAEIGGADTVPVGTALQLPQPLFPRIEVKKPERAVPTAPKVVAPTPVAATPSVTTMDEITIEDFAKVQLRIARVLEAEPIEGSDKLLKLQVIIGEERRQLVAGIKASYAPIDLVGRQVVVVYNLKPAKLRGVESQGMILAASEDDGGAILLQPDRETPEGAKVK
jgi:methionyl-tRNA synthetase